MSAFLSMIVKIFWVVRPCNSVGAQLRSFETSVNIYRTPWCHIPEVCTLHSCICENFNLNTFSPHLFDYIRSSQQNSLIQTLLQPDNGISSTNGFQHILNKQRADIGQQCISYESKGINDNTYVRFTTAHFEEKKSL